jgi:putative membrane protein
LQSTSSSAKSPASKRSATEALAARYRHLFVLPRTPTLVAFAALTSLLLGLVTRGGGWLVAFIAAAAVLLLSGLALSSALLIRDKGTIATFRRVTAVLLASQLAWLLFAGAGAAYSFAVGSVQPLANAVVFAAFACAGLEFLIINGAFTRSAPLSAVLALVHPVGTFLVLGSPLAAAPPAYISVGAGLVSLSVIVAFPLLLGRRRTSKGHDVIALFQAFLKTWTSRRAADLEAIIMDHAEPAQVTTKVMRFQSKDGDIFVVMPGVHPGPFFPVGSYNLPGLISEEFKGLGPVMAFHRPGGHERNLASNDEAAAYASAIREFAEGVEPTQAGTIRGPVSSRVGKATVSSFAFAGDALLTISFAPLGSDDLEPHVEDELSRVASEAGFDSSVVDAHNSIGRERENPDTADPGWKRLLEQVKEAEAKPMKIAYAHSSETDFAAGADITKNGVGLLMLEAEGVKSVLVLADANNAAPPLHEEAARALDSEGFRLIEICTSDSHDLAARGLTVSRGYEALGEDTPIESIRRLVVRLAKLAEPRLSPCRYGSGKLTGEVKVFGSAALEEFASITQASSRFAKSYSKIAAVCTAALFVLSLAA